MKLYDQRLQKLRNLLWLSWSKQTCYPGCVEQWSKTNKSLGQCAVSSLVVQEYLGGELAKIKVGGVGHYFNLIDGEIIDTTGQQFGGIKLDYNNYRIVKRQQPLADPNTNQRYQILKNRVANLLSEFDQLHADILKLDYKQMGVASLDNDGIWFGSNNDIVIVGEAPSPRGWLKSGLAWHSIDQKIIPSGAIMQKLLSVIDRELLDVTFVEAIKCLPADRKYLKPLADLYKPTLIRQLQLLQPNLVLTMGEVPTKLLVNQPQQKLGDLVDQEFTVDGLTIIPIYHPSPISPRSYQGNLPVFEKIKETMAKFSR